MESQKETKTVEVDAQEYIATQEKVIENLKKEIEALEIRKSNLEAQGHSAQIASEQEKKLEQETLRKKQLEGENRIKKMLDNASSRIAQADLREERLKEREAMLERREQEVVDLDKKRLQINEERSNFHKYKLETEQSLRDAKVVIAEAAAMEEKIRMANEMLVGRERVIKDKEKFWNDRIGELEALEKKIEIERQNLEGLRQVEVVNAG